MLKDSYLACKSALEKGGIENAAFEAQCMLEHLTGFGRASLLAHGGDAFDRQDELDEMKGGSKTSRCNIFSAAGASAALSCWSAKAC